METIIQGTREGFWLICNLDAELLQITRLSLGVSLTALIIAAILGIPSGAALALRNVFGRRFWLNVIYTLMGLPPVLAGLVVYLFLSTKGPLGEPSCFSRRPPW